MTNQILAYTRFFWEGVFNGSQTGAVFPSQRFLVAEMIRSVPRAFSGLILELGAGTGVVTLRLAHRCPDARVVACELNPLLARSTRQLLEREGFSNRVELFNRPAEELLKEVAHGHNERPGHVISGIPLGTLDREKVNTLVDRVWQVLPTGGTFTQFQHSLLDRKKIRRRFPQMRTTPVWLNVPPAVVYRAVK